MPTHQVIRNVMWLGFFGAVLLAWALMFQMAMRADLDLIGRPGAGGVSDGLSFLDPLLDLCRPVAEFGPLFAMWAIMMAAMMLPTLVPSLQTYERLMVSANGTRAGWLGLIAGYGLVWTGGAAAFAGAQLALMHFGVVDLLGAARSPAWAGAFLLLAGLFQFTSLKQTCQTVCMAPMTYFMGAWRTGFGGGLRMGLGLGGYCVGCCWAIMGLGFVGGVMSLLWMGLATLFMVAEKLPDIGTRISRPIGFALVIAGAGLIGASFV